MLLLFILGFVSFRVVLCMCLIYLYPPHSLTKNHEKIRHGYNSQKMLCSYYHLREISFSFNIQLQIFKNIFSLKCQYNSLRSQLSNILCIIKKYLYHQEKLIQIYQSFQVRWYTCSYFDSIHMLQTRPKNIKKTDIKADIKVALQIKKAEKNQITEG